MDFSRLERDDNAATVNNEKRAPRDRRQIAASKSNVSVIGSLPIASH